MGILNIAVNYVTKQKWPVIPLKQNSKIPLIDWKEYQTRLPTQEELKKWFQGTQNNIGIVTGQLSNLSVLDVDNMDNLPKEVFSAMSVLTVRGRHLYFKYSGETNSASKIADKIDVRGEGGFVVAAGSVVDGFSYRFINNVINTKLLKPFPKELLNGTQSGVIKPTNEPGWISKTVDTIQSGGPRTPNFVKLIGRYHFDGHLPSDIFALLKPLANECGHNLEKLKNEIEDITKKEGKRLSEGSTVHPSGDKAENIEAFLKGEEKVDWIVPQVLAKSSLAFAAGLPEVFKTWILMDLAIECARGGEWLGMKVNKCRTLFVDQERFIGETRRRFKKMFIGKNIVMDADINSNLIVQVGSTTRLNLDDSFEAFRRKLQDIKPDLIIVDSFATFSTVAENDRQEVQKVLERVKAIRQEFKCAVLMIDHEGKSVLNPDVKGEMPDAYKMVGSVGKPAAAETVLTIRKESANTATVYHTKSTLAPAIAPIQVQIEDTDNDGVRIVCHG